MNADLAAGMAEGSFRTINPNRGGVVESTTYAARRDLYSTWYGSIHEAPSKVLGDGTVHHNPYFVATPAPVEIQ